MQKALTEMNLQLHHVVADITGGTGLRMLAAVRIRAKTAENLTDGRRTGGAAVGCGLSDRKFDCLPPTIGL
jgi:hypothetical protein